MHRPSFAHQHNGRTTLRCATQRGAGEQSFGNLWCCSKDETLVRFSCRYSSALPEGTTDTCRTLRGVARGDDTAPQKAPTNGADRLSVCAHRTLLRRSAVPRCCLHVRLPFGLTGCPPTPRPRAPVEVSHSVPTVFDGLVGGLPGWFSNPQR